jgi:hypothetical protein
VEKITKLVVLGALSVFILLVGIYGLTYSGSPVSDDEQLFAAVSQSITAGNEPSAPQLYGNYRLLGEYIRSGSLHMLLGAVVLRGIQNTGLGQVQAVYLLPIVYTALSAALLVLILAIYGFELSTSVVNGLLFGIATIAWPYSQMFFREPLAMLLLTCVWLAVLLASEPGAPPRRQAAFSLLAIVFFVGVLLTKVILLAVLPGLVYLLWSRRFPTSWKKGLLGLGVFLILAFLLSLVLPPNRLTSHFFSRLWQARGWFPFDEIPTALLGMLAAPAKGLLVYNPALLLLTIAWWKSSLGGRKMIVFALLSAGGVMLAQAAAYGSRWWAITWGTRFLLPVLPLLAASLAPAIDSILASPRRILRVGFWAVFGLGAMIQLGGVLVSNSAYTIDLYYGQYVLDMGDVLWSFRHAPLIAHWRLLLEGAQPNLAFWRCFSGAAARTALIVMLFVLLIVGGLLLARRAENGRTGGLGKIAIITALFLLVLPPMLLAGYRLDPRYGADREDIRILSEVLEEEVEAGDVILVFPYLRTTWNYFFNFYRGPADWVSLPNTYPSGDVNSTMSLVESLGEDYDRVWLVSETAAWEPESTFVEGYLFQFGEVEKAAIFPQVDENLKLRLMLYDLVFQADP